MTESLANIGAYSDPYLDELVSGEPKIDDTNFLSILQSVEGEILELGCGYGRITIPLAKRGIKNLTGLDLSEPSIVYAKEKSGHLPIKWVHGDIRTFQLNQRFDFIFARGSVFGFLLTTNEQKMFLHNVHTHLTEDGQFLFDFYPDLSNKQGMSAKEVPWFDFDHPNGRKIFVSGKDNFDKNAQTHTQICFERWDHSDGNLVRDPWTLTMRYEKPETVAKLVEESGFKIAAQFANYNDSTEVELKDAELFLCQKI